MAPRRKRGAGVTREDSLHLSDRAGRSEWMASHKTRQRAVLEYKLRCYHVGDGSKQKIGDRAELANAPLCLPGWREDRGPATCYAPPRVTCDHTERKGQGFLRPSGWATPQESDTNGLHTFFIFAYSS